MCSLCVGAAQPRHRLAPIPHNISGKQVSLFTGSTEDPFCNIYHERLRQNISINGRHEAIAVEIDAQELIFDNIHPEGISRVDWINNLYCPAQDLGGNFQITRNYSTANMFQPFC
jgi:hypothetical protein